MKRIQLLIGANLKIIKKQRNDLEDEAIEITITTKKKSLLKEETDREITKGIKNLEKIEETGPGTKMTTEMNLGEEIEAIEKVKNSLGEVIEDLEKWMKVMSLQEEEIVKEGEISEKSKASKLPKVDSIREEEEVIEAEGGGEEGTEGEGEVVITITGIPIITTEETILEVNYIGKKPTFSKIDLNELFSIKKEITIPTIIIDLLLLALLNHQFLNLLLFLHLLSRLPQLKKMQEIPFLKPRKWSLRVENVGLNQV